MQIPLPVLDDLCMRFVDNIPDAEQFAKQLINRSEALIKYRNHVDQMVEQFRSYKSFIPTCGAIMFDSTLTKILLVQGYFASKNSWGFPKGKVNEDEDPKVCAIREVLEETGYDITNKIVPDVVFNYFLNDSMVFLYVATDIDKNFNFHPHLRKEIRKIAWFNINDLPRHRNDFDSCTLPGFCPKNFYGVFPAIDFIRKFSTEQIKIRQFSQKKLSAFQPVIPKAQTRQLPTLPPQSFPACALETLLLNESCSSSTSGLNTSNFLPYSNIQSQPTITSPGSSRGSTSGKLFGVFSPDNNTTPKSTRPQNLPTTSKVSAGYMSAESENILKSLLKTPTASNNPPALYGPVDIPINQEVGAGVIGEGSSRKSSQQNLEIRHPIPIQSSSIIKPNTIGSLSFNPTPNTSLVNMAANVSNTTLQSQFGTIGSSSNRSATSERDFSVSPRDEDLNYSTPPLLLPSDLLASSPAAGAKDSLATQAYLEAYSLIAKSPNKKERGRRRTRRSTKDESEHEEEISQPPGRSSSSIIPKNSSTTIQSPESAVPEALSSLFSAARNTGGVIKSTTSGGQSTESRPVFHAEIERNIAELGTVVRTSETNIDKYEFSGTESTDSDEPKIYEKVYDKEESDADSEGNAGPRFDVTSINEDESGKEEENESPTDSLATPNFHNGHGGFRISPLKLCRAWEGFHLDLSRTNLSSLFN